MKRSRIKTDPEKVKAWNQRSRKPLAQRSGLKTRTTLSAKKAINKVGRVGKANIASRKEIAKKAEKRGLDRCEVGPVLKKYGIESGCTKTWPLAPAHKHKRAFYKGDPEALADENQWVAACTNCHDTIEHDAALTEVVFEELRGNE